MSQKLLKTQPVQPPVTALRIPAEENGLALYIHWPWCLKKCPYCDFNSHAVKTYPREAYISSILAEIGRWKSKIGNQRVVSVFFGGGTPSLMKGPEIAIVLAEISRLFTIDPDVEITAECNPTSASSRLLEDFLAAGINRVSIGVQGLSAEILTFLGRQHSADQALRTLESAQKTFKNVSADLIFGLPGQSLVEWKAQLAHMATMGLSHLSCYQLTIEPHTAFFSQVRRGEWHPLDSDRQADFMEATREILTDDGYEHYETSNFARPGLACRHNLHVWRYGNYLGIGAGAHGRVTLGNQRLATRVRKDPADYIARVEAGQSSLVEEEVISPAEAWREAVMVGLRLGEGICLDRLARIIPSPVEESGLDMRQMRHLRGAGLLWQEGTRWGTTPQGQFVLDGMLEAIFLTPRRG